MLLSSGYDFPLKSPVLVPLYCFKHLWPPYPPSKPAQSQSAMSIQSAISFLRVLKRLCQINGLTGLSSTPDDWSPLRLQSPPERAGSSGAGGIWEKHTFPSLYLHLRGPWLFWCVLTDPHRLVISWEITARGARRSPYCKTNCRKNWRGGKNMNNAFAEAVSQQGNYTFCLQRVFNILIVKFITKKEKHV